MWRRGIRRRRSLNGHRSISTCIKEGRLSLAKPTSRRQGRIGTRLWKRLGMQQGLSNKIKGVASSLELFQRSQSRTHLRLLLKELRMRRQSEQLQLRKDNSSRRREGNTQRGMGRGKI